MDDHDNIINSVPSVISFFLEFSIELVNQTFLGKLFYSLLDGNSLGNMWTMMTRLSVGVGLAYGLDLSAAAVVKTYFMLGKYLQRCLSILQFWVLISIAFFASEFFNISEMRTHKGYSGSFLQIIIPVLFISSFLQGHGLFWMKCYSKNHHWLTLGLVYILIDNYG